MGPQSLSLPALPLLCSNWDSECQKWLKGRVRTLPLCESSRDEALASITQFLSPRCPFQARLQAAVQICLPALLLLAHCCRACSPLLLCRLV